MKLFSINYLFTYIEIISFLSLINLNIVFKSSSKKKISFYFKNNSKSFHNITQNVNNNTIQELNKSEMQELNKLLEKQVNIIKIKNYLINKNLTKNFNQRFLSRNDIEVYQKYINTCLENNLIDKKNIT